MVVALACGDAGHVPKQSKAIISAVVVMCHSFVGLTFYFQGKDVTWNPFESYGIKESNISFKSVYLSSLTNIVLFSSKYWVKDIYRLLHKLMKVYACTTSNGSDENDINIMTQMMRLKLIKKVFHTGTSQHTMQFHKISTWIT